MKQGLIEHPNGSKYWYKDGELHRLDGPAIENPDGAKRWFKDGKEYTKAEYLEWRHIQATIKQA